MMWIGAILLISTTTLVGFDISRRLDHRPKQIRQLKNALQVIEAEILYSQRPLRDVFSILALQIPKPTQYLFEHLSEAMQEPTDDFRQIWADEVSAFINESALGGNEEEILQQFGQTLGRHNFEQQQKHIHLAISHLERELDEARDHQTKYAKLAKSLGVLSGLFMVLLLI